MHILLAAEPGSLHGDDKGDTEQRCKWSEHEKIFLSSHLVLVVYQCLCNRNLFLLQIGAPKCVAMLVQTLPWKNKNRLAHDVTDWRLQNTKSQCLRQLLTNQTTNFAETLGVQKKERKKVSITRICDLSLLKELKVPLTTEPPSHWSSRCHHGSNSRQCSCWGRGRPGPGNLPWRR